MPSVPVRIPSLLRSLLHIPKSISASGETLDQALQDLRKSAPQLALHLFDETGAFREHVLCFVNDTNSRDVDASTHRLKEGDVLTILQAVSGG